MMRFQRKNISGFSLAEIVTTVAIVSIVGIAIGTFQSSIWRNDRAARSRLVAAEESRLTLRRFLEEVRNASPSSTGAYPILIAQKSAFTFYADIDNDNLKERIRYYLETGSLKKAVLKPTGSPPTYTGSEKIFTMVRSIASTTSGVFSYYDTSEALLVEPISPANVRSVRLTLPAIISTGGSVATTTSTIESRATLRNLKDNY